MAFLDNSGDIILDAVLTDVGRKRMADGKFKITKFGLGDDEVNYGQYNPSHTSGSAYYDLEIMQTPVLEAATSINSNINYGLITLPDLELLYLPVLEFNEKSATDIAAINRTRHNNMFIVAANTETQTEIGNLGLGINSLLASNSSPAVGIIWESGLNTADKAATENNRSTMIVNKNLLDRTFILNADNKFIDGTLGFSAGSTSNSVKTDGDNTLVVDVGYGSSYATAIGSSAEIEGFNTFRVEGAMNMIVDNTGGDSDIYSAILGPRGTIAALNLSIPEELTSKVAGTRSRLYNDYGTIGQSSDTVFGSGGTSIEYDYVDTTIYVQGTSSGATLQIPIRIIRQSAS